MAKVQLATRIDSRVKKALQQVCQQQGLKMTHFIESAIIDKIEELEDLEDLRQIRQEKTRPLAKVLAELGLGDEVSG
ncbi:hypothetical protein MYX82_11200 [Acidobacteria bacterium AH-259-D05]|nr:hypothetical protein [Acidobacteria bacterium AH-259-D05]